VVFLSGDDVVLCTCIDLKACFWSSTRIVTFQSDDLLVLHYTICCERLKWPCEGAGLTRISGKWVYGLIQLAKCLQYSFCCASTTKEPVEPYYYVFRLYSPFWSVTPCLPSVPTSHPFVSTHGTASAHATAQILYLIWQKTIKAATNSKGGLKSNKLMHTVCKFLMLAYFPWQVIMNYNSGS